MYFLFDIGGSTMRLGVSPNGKDIGNPKLVETPQNFDSAIKLIKTTAMELARGETITAVAGGVAAVFNQDKSQIINASHLKEWVNKPFKNNLTESFHSPVFLENDAAIVGLGESISGPGLGNKIVVYITVSTGVGGARIVNGKIDEKVTGFEPGHQIIEVNGALCPSCNLPGHLEGYISGSAFKKKYNKNPQEIDDVNIWEEAAKYLAVGLNNIIVHWSPDVIVLGGGMMHKIPLDSVKTHLKTILNIFPQIPEIEKAKLDDNGGLYGALEYLKQHIS